MQLANSLETLLRTFSPVFTDPSFQTFRSLMTGWILSVRHRYVTDLIISSDSVGNGHFSDYHRFFSRAVWDIDHLWKLLARLIVALSSSKSKKICQWGHDWVDLCIVIADSCLSSTASTAARACCRSCSRTLT